MALAETFEKELGRRLEFAAPIDTGSKALTEAAIAHLYKIMGNPAPAVIWCQSLYQMATLPSILIGMFFSDAWQIASGALASRFVDESWEQDYEMAWEALWAHGGQQLLRGMKQTSRIGSLHWNLEAALFQQCKREMAGWLQSKEKLQAFEDKLPKEIIYRQFWAMHLWHLNSMQDRLRKVSAELSASLAGENQVLQQQWQQFAPYHDRLLQFYSGAETSIHSLINRMGAEPNSQLRHCAWLPMSFPLLGISQIWADNVDSQVLKNYLEEIAAWNRLSQSTMGVICLDHVAFACEKPSVFLTDEGGRLHSDKGPAIVFRDGYIAHSWHGVIVDARIIEEPESITLAEIDNTQNAEMRRVLIERYGQSQYLQDSGAEEIHRDEYGVLYRKEIPGDEDLVMVKVVNSSPEPDGSFKDYFLRVPPDVLTAKQAVAWTFGFEADEYLPLAET